MSADGKDPSRVHSPREVESSNKIYPNSVHWEEFDSGTSHTGRGQQSTIRGSPRSRGRAEHQGPGTEPTIANNYHSHPEWEATFPPRTSSRGPSSAPGEPTGLSPAPSPRQPLLIPFNDPNGRAPGLHTVTPSGAENGIYSAEAIDSEKSRRRIGALQEQLRDNARFHLRHVEHYEKELKKQADLHKRELQRRATFHERELQEAVYEKEQSQAARDYARDQAQFARQESRNEVGHLQEIILEMELRAQRDKEKHAVELRNALISVEKAVKIVNQLEERLGRAEEEVIHQRQNMCRNRDLELMLEEANSKLSFQSAACNHWETELRGYKAQLKRYKNLWQNMRHQFKGEKRALLHQIALRDRYISIFDQYQRIYNKNVKQKFIQNDKELVQLKAVLVDLKVVVWQKIRSEIKATRVNDDNLRNSIEATWRCRNALEDQPDDPDEDDETAESKFCIKQAGLVKFQAELKQLYEEQKQINATTDQLRLQDLTISAEVMQLRSDLRKPTNSVQKPGGVDATEIKCLKRSLYKLHTEFIGSQRQSSSSLPELVQDDNAEDDVDDASDDWHSTCHTPDRLTQVYAMQDDQGRSSIASQLLSKKQKRASSYLSPTPWI